MLVAIGCDDGPHKSVYAYWETKETCDRGLDVNVYGAKKSSPVTIGSVKGTTDKYGGAKLKVPATAVSVEPGKELEIDVGGEKLRVRVPDWVPGKQGLAFQYITSATTQREDWSGDARVVSGGSDTKPVGRHGAVDAEGRLALPLPCGVASGTVANGEVKVVDANPMAIVDVRSALAKVDLSKPDPAIDEIRVQVKTHWGAAGEVAFTGKLKTASLATMFATDKPMDGAPAFTKGKKQPVLVFYGKGANTDLAKGSPLTDIALVAVATISHAEAGSCGPYEGAFGGVGDMITKYRANAEVTVRELKTGKVIATKKFPGANPACPQFVTIETLDNIPVGKPGDHYGSPPKDKVTAWLQSIR